MNNEDPLVVLAALLLVAALWLLIYALFLPMLVLGISTLLNLGLGYSQAFGVSLIMWLFRFIVKD